MDLPAYLAERQITPTAFAGEIGVPPSTIHRIIRGERDPRGATIRKIVAGTAGKVTATELIASTPGPRGAGVPAPEPSADERAKPLRCLSPHGGEAFVTEGQSR
ncbi:helix-turn-helix domain-containing protein [Methylorubrum extorquens]|uniref:Helix-turn-helix transcriptional regulator n=1 Tax=Methylorubrum extorquens TaxID=408 RepID=A0AAX3WMA6_METEX|nr:helix-turn-helix transcriptional regulator [Methylorubrum extorquens]WHQ72556.1 helix-turn-helix transcriptional regulator [Methylorubrum extorquens]